MLNLDLGVFYFEAQSPEKVSSELLAVGVSVSHVTSPGLTTERSYRINECRRGRLSEWTFYGC